MDSDHLYYTSNDKRKGVALIFNHLFINAIKPRYGTNEDCERMDKYFKSLGFESTPCHDYTYENIRKKIEEVSKKTNLEVKCIVVIVMTHGKPDKLEASNGCYSTNRLFQPFMDKNLLDGVPKLFFIQACRGNIFPETNLIVSSDSVAENTDIPFIADFLCMYSTYPGNYALRCEVKGSWFIQALCKVLEDNNNKNMELLELLTLVVSKVAYINPSKNSSKADIIQTQLPQVVSTLTKFLKF